MEHTVYNINTATLDELNALPGMSTDLAQRIQSARPFTSLEEIKHIKGVGGKLFKRWQPLLMVNGHMEAETEPEAEADVPALLEAALVEEVVQAGESSLPLNEDEIMNQIPAATPSVVVQEVVETTTEPPVELKAQPTPVLPIETPATQPLTKEAASRVYVTRTQAVLLAFLSSGLTLILTAGVTLLALFLINGGLQFASLPAFNRLDDQVTQLSNQAEGLEQNLQAVQARLQVVDALSAQVSGMEGEIAGLTQDVQSAQTAVKQIAGSVEQLSQDLDVLTEQVSVFDRFLDGLRSLLNGIAPPANP